LADQAAAVDPKGLSENLLVSHHDNNYAGAARRIGQIQQMLSALPNNAPGLQVKGLKMEELVATHSAILQWIDGFPIKTG
jgi:superoxide dismutase, Fe-Mn family